MVIKSKSLLNENISNSKFVHSLDSSNLSSSLESNFKKPYINVKKISPYLNGTKLQILSQMTEKKIMQKKSTEVTSSFAQACKIYKANSDEFRCVKEKSRKVKTLVLNKFADPGIPQTVSDMNDTEYLTRVDNNRKYRQRKHRMTKSPSHPHGSKNYEFFNGDLLCRSGPAADLNSLNKNKANNCKTIKTKKKKKESENTQSSDVWAMLRNMNRFQWISSPPLSDSSDKTIKKKRKYHKNDKDIGIVETCTTEEFSYVSSYDIKSKSQSILSQPSSFDRVTIIDRTADLKTQESIGPNLRSSKKLACQAKRTKIKKTKKVCHKSIKPLNDVRICDMKNKVYDTLNYNNSTVFKKCLSKESLDGCSNRSGSHKTILDKYDQYIKDINAKEECDKIIFLKPSAYDQCNNSVDANVYRQSNDKLLRDSEQSSRAGMRNIFKARQTIIQNKDKYKNEIPKVSEVAGKNEKESTRDRALVAQKNPRVSLMYPKLTQTEIRRRMASLKFPIVILGKDEISSNFNFVPNEFDHFKGMGQKIWPYMMDWSDDLTINKSLINRRQNSPSTKCQYTFDLKSTPYDNICNVYDENITLRNNMNKESKLMNETNVDHNTSSIKSQKSKVLNQFKRKLLGLISNKGQKCLIKENDGLKDVRYQVNCNNDFNHTKNDIIEKCKTLDSFTKQPEKKYTWSKRKWTSDFIDNIIKKMKKGIYYTHNSEDTKLVQNNETESSIEAVTECEYVNEEMVLENIEDISIPGFENTHNVAPLIVEVKMLTRSQISIHHCLTNVMLQFDIIIPSGVETNSSLSLSSFTPIAHEDKTMVYKCKSSLPNAILPAQLCSVLPKLISQINKAHKSIYKITSKDTNIPSSFIPKTALTLRNTTETLTEGSFYKRTPVNVIPKYVKNKNFFSLDYNSHKMYMKLLPTIQMGVPFVPMNKCINLVISKYHIDDCVNSLISNKPVINYCKALVPYVPCYTTDTLPNSNLKLLLDNNYIQNYLVGVINFMINIKKSHEVSNCESYHYLNKSNDLRPNITKKITINVSISNQPFELIYGSSKSYYGCIEYDQNFLNNRSMIGITKTAEQKRLKNNKSSYHARKHLKKTFKTHKKCKSMTSMIKESDRTLLNKIVTLEDFVQALGSCKQLTTVLRGYTEKNILTSITEMKRWIKEISQAQALLVLLLANKKETKNLKRFRPMLLQGIAVNRITTATELDMEIEVIGKENICISQNEGISFLSTSNSYNLLDELYWIAKTTASDYQKPFDDSSKKLLKSLLEKRKKLNPSYLRVMARYVGLGLLKPRRNYL